MTLLQLTQSLDPESGGMATATQALHHALADSGQASALIGFSQNPKVAPLGQDIRVLPATWPRKFYYSPMLWPLVEELMCATESVHVHGLWVYPNYVAGKAAERWKRPLVIHPHGMLEPWALARSNRKKHLMRVLFENANFKRAALWRALSGQEADQIRAIAPGARICVVPNGVSVPPEGGMQRPFSLEQRFPALRERKWILFLSRLNAKKGLDHLVRAWASLERDFEDWHLVIAGPDDGYEVTLRRLLAQAELEGRVTLTGMLKGDERWGALRHAGLFVLPSYSEGFSMAVLEAMSVGVPVLISEHCNFPAVGRVAAGCVTGLDDQAFAHCLRGMLMLPDEQRRAMGKRGKELVTRNYLWPAVAQQLRTAVADVL